MPDSYKEAMGDDAEETREIIVAMGDLVSVYTTYVMSDEDSPQEQRVGDVLNEMLDLLSHHPQKCADMVMMLLTLIERMRIGESYLEFFKRAGVEAPALVNTETGERR